MVVQLYLPSMYLDHTKATYLRRNELGMQKAAEEIFALEYFVYGGMGKESLSL